MTSPAPIPAIAAEINVELERYCAQTGISVSTLCVRALGNSRFPDRLTRKLEKLDEDVRALRAYMAANPPAVAAHPTPTAEDAA